MNSFEASIGLWLKAVAPLEQLKGLLNAGKGMPPSLFHLKDCNMENDFV